METNQTEETTDAAFSSETKINNSPLVIPIVEEQAFFNKQVVETGKVRISKQVSEHEELIDVPLLHEEVSIERVPVNRYVDKAPAVRHEGDVMIISVVQEQLVMQKRLVLIEELRVRKQMVETHQPQSVTLRKERVDVTRIAEVKTSGD